MRYKAGIIGARNALVGSLLFASTEGVAIGVNETEQIINSIRSIVTWVMIVFVVCCVLSFLPGYLGGRFLMKLRKREKLNKRSLMISGATLGIAAVVLLSFPYLYVVLSAHNYWSINNNPLFSIYLVRLIEAIIIAGLMGSWSGNQISKL